jgi:hypothetical protein
LRALREIFLLPPLGLFALPGPEALRSEIRRIEEQIKKLHADKHKREILLGEVER